MAKVANVGYYLVVGFLYLTNPMDTSSVLAVLVCLSTGVIETPLRTFGCPPDEGALMFS